MKLLVACEFSGIVRDAFIARGHNAISCDLLPTESPGPHYQGDVMDIINDGWDMMIAHPPCQYLCSSGLFRNNNNLERQAKTNEAFDFVMKLANAPIEKICIENSIGCISSRWRRPDQIIQPWQFGHPESKSTCLWLIGLPKLEYTNVLSPPRKRSNGKPLWDNMTESGQNKLGPSADRWKKRSRTYQGIATAMSSQWG